MFDRTNAATFAAFRFEQICDEREALPVAGSMSSLDVAECALQAKEEAEETHGMRITATLDEEGNWSFS